MSMVPEDEEFLSRRENTTEKYRDRERKQIYNQNTRSLCVLLWERERKRKSKSRFLYYLLLKDGKENCLRLFFSHSWYYSHNTTTRSIRRVASLCDVRSSSATNINAFSLSTSLSLSLSPPFNFRAFSFFLEKKRSQLVSLLSSPFILSQVREKSRENRKKMQWNLK